MTYKRDWWSMVDGGGDVPQRCTDYFQSNLIWFWFTTVAILMRKNQGNTRFCLNLSRIYTTIFKKGRGSLKFHDGFLESVVEDSCFHDGFQKLCSALCLSNFPWPFLKNGRGSSVMKSVFCSSIKGCHLIFFSLF